MYWPLGHVQHVRAGRPSGRNDTLLDFCYNRRTNLFVTYSEQSITLWSSEPTCRIARVERTQGSLEEYGLNRLVEWSVDEHSIFVATTANHILKYDLVESEPVEANESSLFISARAARINIDVPHILQSFPPGAGQGEVYDISPSAVMTSTNIPELQFRNGGIMRFKGSVWGQAYFAGHTLSTRQRGLLVAYSEDKQQLVDTTDSDASVTSGFLRIPSKVPDVLLWKGSRTHALPSHGWPYVDADGEDQVDVDKWSWRAAGIHLASNETISQFHSTKIHSMLYVITSFGNAFLVFSTATTDDIQPKDQTVNRGEDSWSSVQIFASPAGAEEGEEREKATSVDLNTSFGLCTVGTSKGRLLTLKVDPSRHITTAWTCSCLDVKVSRSDTHTAVQGLSWTTDGYALAVQLDHQWALYSPFGDLVFRKRDHEPPIPNGKEKAHPSALGSESVTTRKGYKAPALAWLPGNYGLLMLSMDGSSRTGMQIVPFAKSASAMQQDHHSPYRSLVLHDEIRVYRGADRRPEDVLDATKNLFESVKIPLAYAINQWPIRYTAVSADGKLLACAGGHGLTHYSFASGRWKLFAEIVEETSFSVRGGMVWFHHVLIAAVHVNGLHEIRLYSRDLDLEFRNVLHIEPVDHAVLSMSLDDDSLLVYTSNNILHHFLVQATLETVGLRLCHSIPLAEFISTPSHVKSITWALPPTVNLHDDRAQLTAIASLMVLSEGRLLVLRKEFVGYRPIILADPCLAFDGPRGNTGVIWSDNGQRIQLIQKVNWPGEPITAVACAMPQAADTDDSGSLFGKSVLCRSFASKNNESSPSTAVAPHLGLVIRLACRPSDLGSDDQPGFDVSPNPVLILPILLKSLHSEQGLEAAVTFGRRFAPLPYFGHVLEVLLLQALDREDAAIRKQSRGHRLPDTDPDKTEHEGDSSSVGLAEVIQFLDHFPQSTAAVIACARKSEAEMWPLLFDVVGSPRDLFDNCLNADAPALEAASSLLVIIHTLDQNAHLQEDIRRLLAAAFEMKDDKASRIGPCQTSTDRDEYHSHSFAGISFALRYRSDKIYQRGRIRPVSDRDTAKGGIRRVSLRKRTRTLSFVS